MTSLDGRCVPEAWRVVERVGTVASSDSSSCAVVRVLVIRHKTTLARTTQDSEKYVKRGTAQNTVEHPCVTTSAK